MWDERVVGAIVKAAREDLQQQKWARDFADKLKQRGITISLLNRAIIDADAVVLYRHKGRYVIGFLSRTVTSFGGLVSKASVAMGDKFPTPRSFALPFESGRR